MASGWRQALWLTATAALAALLLAEAGGCSDASSGVSCGGGTCASGDTCCDDKQCLSPGVTCCGRGNASVCPAAGYSCCDITTSNPTGCCAGAGGSGGGSGGSGGGSCPASAPVNCFPNTAAPCCPLGTNGSTQVCCPGNTCSVDGAHCGSSGGSGGSGGCTAKVCCGGLYECNGACYATCTPGSQPCCTTTECVCYTPCC